LAAITTTDKEVKMVVEMPGVSKENIRINAYDTSVKVTTTSTDRKYGIIAATEPYRLSP
jgi:HSP20 family protein